MKLSSVAVDPKAIEDGEWVKNLPEMGNLELKCRGQNSAAWRALLRKEINKLPRNLRNRPDGLPIAIQDKINNACLVGVGVLDWKNLELDDGAHDYSKELLAKLLADPVYQIFRDACLTATSRVGIEIAEADEELVGNSGNSSVGSSATAEVPTG